MLIKSFDGITGSKIMESEKNILLTRTLIASAPVWFMP